jgi:TRAP-type C4-dicarboxylate transport system substrate-binding protein
MKHQCNALSRTVRIGRVAVAVALAGMSAAAPAQTKLRVGDSLPVGHFFSEQATKFWMGEVSKATNKAVDFEYYPAEQLGKAKDILALTQSGVIDIGYVVPSYVSDKMPLTAVAELPGTFPTSCAGTLAFWKLATGDGLLAKREYEANGVRVLFTIAMPPYQVFTTQRKLDSVKSFEGLKLRTAGGAMSATVTKLKAVPVNMAAPEVREAMSRGTLDGMVFPSASVLAYDIAGLVKSATAGENFGTAVLTYMISNNRWNSLTPAVRKAMQEAGEAATRRVCAFADKAVEGDLEKIRQKGAVVAPLPAAEQALLRPVMASVRQEWAAQIDKRGGPGTELLKAFEAALK